MNKRICNRLVMGSLALLLAVGNGPAAQGAEAARMTMSQYIGQVLRANSDIVGQQMSTQIAQEGIKQAKGAFEPVGKANVSRASLRQKNTAEEDLIRQNLGIYSRKNTGYEMGASVLMPTGATLEGKWGVEGIDSNLQAVANKPREFKSFYELSLNQPLAKDGGFDATLAKTRIAELESAVAGMTSLEVSSAVISKAISAYLDLRLAQERQTIWQEGLATAEKMVAEAQRLEKSERLSETARIDVENGLLLYQIGVAEAEQQVVEAMGKARTLLMLSSQEDLPPLAALDPLPAVDKRQVKFQESMQRGLSQRADYQGRLLALQREGIRVAYAENQTLPRIDLIASYGINGLEYDSSKVYSALDSREYPSWKLGLQMTSPLMGNESAQAQLRMARLNKEKALLESKALETAMANDITSALAAMESSRQRWESYQRLLKAGEKQLAFEKQLLAGGRSDQRNVLAREEAMVRNRVSLREQVVAYAKAKVALEMAQGTLLATYGGGMNP